jgi:predicted small integral membrane protein
MRTRALRLLLLVGLAVWLGAKPVPEPEVGPYPCPPPCGVAH